MLAKLRVCFVVDRYVAGLWPPRQGIRGLPRPGIFPTMADRNEQMAHQGWAKGYADGYIAGLEEAWARVNARIERGPLPRDQDERRNGLVLARNTIACPGA